MKKYIIDPILFKTPPALVHPGYFWMLDEKLDDKSIVEPMTMMNDAGAKNACPHPMPPEFRPRTTPSALTPEYLSEDYFRAAAKMYETAEKLGMNCYLYDEGGWPSGSACGRVWASDPERFARKYVAPDGNGGYVIKNVEYDPAITAPSPNVLHPEVTKKFLELTHEGYARHISRHFGKSCKFTFTDEPAFTSGGDKLPWVDDLPEEFKKRKGYDIVPHLGDIVNKKLAAFPSKTGYYQIDYYDVVSQLFVERFLLPIREWCHRHKLKSGGHFGGEDEPERTLFQGYGHILRSLRALDLPGVDVIWRQLYPGVRSRVFPKFASSAAHQNGSKYALGEIFAIYGSGLTPAVIRWIADYLLVRGVNLLVVSSFKNNPQGKKITDRCFGCHNPLWKYMEHFHRYTARTAWMLSLGKPVISTAVYFDIRSIWMNQKTAINAVGIQETLCRKLMERRIDFDFVDDDIIQDGKVNGKSLQYGAMRYHTVIIPMMAMLPEESRQKLELLKKSGVNIISEEEIYTLPQMMQCFPETEMLRIQKRKLKNGYLYFAVNESMSDLDVTLTIPEKLPVIRCDAASGKIEKIRSCNGSWKWHFSPGSSELFLIGEHDAPYRKESKLQREISGTWQISPLCRHSVEENSYAVTPLPQKFQPVALGDWRQVLSREYSGDAVYAIDFECKDPQKWHGIDLGKVNYSAQVILNGQKLGKLLWGPFRFDVKDALKTGTNHLEIIVSNTLSNAIEPEHVLEDWQKKWSPLQIYEPIYRAFESDSLESGLYGPVTLF